MTGNPAELGQYLRARRQRLSPSDVGLPEGGRRRTAGLRREEVAGLAAISADWYTRLEQGRGVQASAQVLDSLARVLRLDGTERQHLFHLARGEFPPVSAAPADDVPGYLHQFLCYLEPSPAMLLGRRLDVLDANAATAGYFGDHADWPAGGRYNLVARLCLDPGMRQLLGPGWEQITGDMVAQLRAAAARWPADPSFTTLTATLSRHSPDFTRRWADHQVRGSSSGAVVLHHPQHGPVTFQHMAFHPTDAPHLRVVAYLPDDLAIAPDSGGPVPGKIIKEYGKSSVMTLRIPRPCTENPVSIPDLGLLGQERSREASSGLRLQVWADSLRSLSDQDPLWKDS